MEVSFFVNFHAKSNRFYSLLRFTVSFVDKNYPLCIFFVPKNNTLSLRHNFRIKLSKIQLRYITYVKVAKKLFEQILNSYRNESVITDNQDLFEVQGTKFLIESDASFSSIRDEISEECFRDERNSRFTFIKVRGQRLAQLLTF